MVRKSKFDTQKLKLAFLVLMVVNMAFALGILIGQRNSYNTTFAGTIETKTETGLAKNTLSEIVEKPIMGLKDKPTQVGSIKYVNKDGKFEYELSINSNFNNLTFGEKKKDIPTSLSIESMSYTPDVTNVVYTKVGTIDLKKNGNQMTAKFYGTFEFKSLQVKQIVLKANNQEDTQNIYLYNDTEIPEKLNNTPMPYFWTVL
jgi:hypothetical protein